MKNLLMMAVVAMACGSAFAESVRIRTYGGVPADPGKVVVRDIRPLDPPPSAGESAAAFSVVPGLAWPGSGYDIRWIRFNLLLGRHRTMRGFDFGLLANITDYEASGIGFAGLFNMTGLSGGALHLAALFNYSEWDFSGVQLAGGLSMSEGYVRGFQFAFVTSAGRLDGLQIGGFNHAEQGTGVQFGVVNCSERLSGLQVGLLNINLDSSVPVLPIVNCAF